MIERYSLPEISRIWSEQRKLEIWLEIEVSVCEALANAGVIPKKDAAIIRKKAKFNINQVRENEKRTNHDVIAFIEEVAAQVGPAGRWLHFGMTSSDLLDTAIALQLVESADILLKDIAFIRSTAAALAIKHKSTAMIGRSHGIHAEPITFGLKIALLYDEFGRAEQRLRAARETVRVGKISGAVGTFAHLDPEIEAEVCKKLGLRPDPLGTQIIQRDRHAEFITTLALIGCSIDRWATEFRHLQRTEVLEVEEYFAPGQKGSSAMPHKRNPITGERLSGLARLLRGYAISSMENVPLWHERDISHSSTERVIFPDCCGYLHYMLVTLNKLLAGLQIYPDAMHRNLWATGGIFFSQSLLLEMTRRGTPRRSAYETIQSIAMRTWEKIRTGKKTGNLFLEEALSDHELKKILDEKTIKDLCSEKRHFRHIDTFFQRVGIISGPKKKPLVSKISAKKNK